MTDLDKLIEAVEAGTTPTAMGVNQALQCGFDSLRIDQVRAAINGSLDAAHRLHEALLPGWDFVVYPDSAEVAKVARLEGYDISDCHFADSATPARAWLLAILRALKAKEDHNATV